MIGKDMPVYRDLWEYNNRTKRAVGVVGRALVTQERVRLAGNALGESRRKAGLADPGLTRNQHDLPFTPPSEALAFQQEIDFVLTAEKIGHTRRADRLEAALGRREALDRVLRLRCRGAIGLRPPL
jgi:hypothetical protein